MKEIDFKQIEEAAFNRFKETLSEDAGLATAIGAAAARVTAFALQEYHKKLQEKEE